MVEAQSLERGQYIIYNGEILRIVRKEVIACGTHSHSKTKLFLQSLFSRGEKQVVLQHHDKVDMLEIIKKQGQVVAKLQNKVQVMDMKSYETFDAEAAEELFNNIKEGDEVTFIDVNGKFSVIEKRG